MSSPPEIVKAKNAVLQKIGRNVVNFQKMEKMLKVLTSHCEVSAQLSDLERIKRTAKRIERQPMGILANRFIETAYSDEPRLPEDGGRSQDVWISYSIEFDASDSSTKAATEALSDVVRERDLLLHQWLNDLDPNSIDSCSALSVRLDEQYGRIWPQFEALALMVGTLREHHEELERYLNSDAFVTDLREVTDD